MSRPKSQVDSEAHKRPNRQQVAAAATKREILLAARRLIAARGYAQTSMVEIAEEAGVSVPTIYASVGPKSAIVLALVGLVDLEVGGGDARERVGVETDPVQLLGLAAHLNRVLQERFGDIVGAVRSAAPMEPAVASALEKGQQMHRHGSARAAARLEGLDALRAGVTAAEAADVISLLTDGDCYATLVGRYGWTFDRAEAWIADTLKTILLKTP